MIRRIEQIKAFGVFADLRWPATLPDFKQFNLIYGWNYSGKTTLSRAFRCFEQKRPHADFADAQVELKSEDGTVHHLSSPQAAPLFRVFNSDFVHENLAFDEGIANPILVLGSEDIARLEKLDAKKAERESTAVLIEANKQKKDEKEKKIERAFTKDARDLIKNPLSVPNYDKTHFEREVTACKETPNTYLLKDKALQKWLSVYCSTDKKPELSTKVVSLCSVGDLVKKSTALLKRVVTTNAPIPRLKENPILENWVNDGRPLHEGESTCQFCGQLLPPALLSHLTGHFSADYENLMSELDILLNAIQVAQDQQLVLDHRSDFYAELSERFIDAKNRLDEHLKVRSSALEALEKILIAKRTKAFTSLLCPVVEDPAHQIATAIEEINAIIAEHNKQTTQFDKRRREAFSNLERHYAASFVLDQHYSDHLQEMVTSQCHYY